jgi:hypothetical protein
VRPFAAILHCRVFLLARSASRSFLGITITSKPDAHANNVTGVAATCGESLTLIRPRCCSRFGEGNVPQLELTRMPLHAREPAAALLPYLASLILGAKFFRAIPYPSGSMRELSASTQNQIHWRYQ